VKKKIAGMNTYGCESPVNRKSTNDIRQCCFAKSDRTTTQVAGSRSQRIAHTFPISPSNAGNDVARNMPGNMAKRKPIDGVNAIAMSNEHVIATAEFKAVDQYVSCGRGIRFKNSLTILGATCG
jgi:hypothetical protein